MVDRAGGRLSLTRRSAGSETDSDTEVVDSLKRMQNQLDLVRSMLTNFFQSTALSRDRDKANAEIPPLLTHTGDAYFRHQNLRQVRKLPGTFPTLTRPSHPGSFFGQG